ncbi:MAG TPA: DinB family protein, partial [Blastocatellia bacterium]
MGHAVVGPLIDAVPSVERTERHNPQKESFVPRKSLTPEQSLTALAETPQRIAELTDGLTPDQLHAAPDPDEWSANDVLAHLRACADVWGNCIAEILEQDTPTLRAVNPTTWIKNTDYREQKFRRSLRAFARQRTSL